MKSMFPVATEVAVWPTVAVKVTDWPNVAGFGVAATVIRSPDDVPVVPPDSSAPIEGGLGLTV